MTTATEVDVELLPKQWDFVRSDVREVLYSGAFGAGKTRGLCHKLLTHAVVPGNRVGLCRKTYADLRATTLKTLLQEEGDLPPVLPEGTYLHNKSEHTIQMQGGGEIFYFGFDSPLKRGSLNFGAVGIDEGIELDEDEYTMLLGRIRNTAAAVRQIFTATNPGPPTHFLFERFIDRPHAERQLIQTNSLENPYLPDDYIALLKSFTGTSYDRYVMGNWVGFEGLVYDSFDRDKHVIEKPGPWKRVVLGVDEGYTNPAVIVALGLDSDGRGHVFKEFYRAQVLQDEFVRTVKAMATETGAEVAVVDPSAAGLIQALRQAGIDAVAANNAVFEGIQAVQTRLACAGDGLPRLTVSPTCEETLRELQTYQWKKNKDEPVKEYDHAMDALRYAVMHLERPEVTVWEW